MIGWVSGWMQQCCVGNWTKGESGLLSEAPGDYVTINHCSSWRMPLNRNKCHNEVIEAINHRNRNLWATGLNWSGFTLNLHKPTRKQACKWWNKLENEPYKLSSNIKLLCEEKAISLILFLSSWPHISCLFDAK